MLKKMKKKSYGFAFASEEEKLEWKNLVFEYLQHRKALKRVLLLVDARHGLKMVDLEMIKYLESFKG